ncbi:hypothetical protein V2J09_017016 [Rumex salicifolius]
MALERWCTSNTMIIAIGIISMALNIGQGRGLSVGFYNGKCKGKNVESIIFDVVKANFNKSDTAAVLLRMQFHDCFVRGCDASILLEGKKTEKNGGPNASVRGYELIDAAKAAVEKECPDGLVSLATEANTNLPSPTVPISTAINLFAARNLTVQDFVLLLGAHTIGITHCSFVQSRLYNFQNTNRTDPSMNSTLVESLKQTCPKDGSGRSNPIFLDQTQGSESTIDTGFYKAITQNKGVLQIDQRMATDPLTKDVVARLLNNDFPAKFGDAMVRLGRVPLSGGEGEIRRSCRATNAGKGRHPKGNTLTF